MMTNWDDFAKANNFLPTQEIRCCYRCRHAEHGYEGEIDCGHALLVGSEYTDSYALSVCDLFEAAEG